MPGMPIQSRSNESEQLNQG